MAARESISPLLRNVQTRRLSLELCQKIGNHLLSPNRNSNVEFFPSSPSKNFNSSQFSRFQQSPQPTTPTNNFRRGSSGCISPLTASFNSFNNSNQNLDGQNLNRRRSSLTPIPQFSYSVSPPPLNSGFRRRPATNVNEAGSFPIPTIGIIPPPDYQNCFSPNKLLGKGSFGTVVAGMYHGQPVAVKVIQTTTPNHIVSLKGEGNALRLQSHPNIARIYEILQLVPEQAIIVMERLTNGSLLTILNDSSFQLTGTLCVRFSTEIASALSYCHSSGILHLDVKPSNILIDYQNHCKLCDFGNSKTMQDLVRNPNFAKLDGTVAYIAPECFRGITPTNKCDVYSFGITMWQMLSRESPYQGETEHSIIYKVVAQAMRPTKITEGHSAKFNSAEALKKYIDTYEYCWQQYPEVRPDLAIVAQRLLSF